jgi:hypothetical protein
MAPRARERESGSLAVYPSALLSYEEKAMEFVISLMTPLSRMINPLLQRPLRMRNRLGATPKPHPFADIIPPLFTPVTSLARQTYFQRYLVAYFKVGHF